MEPPTVWDSKMPRICGFWLSWSCQTTRHSPEAPQAMAGVRSSLGPLLSSTVLASLVSTFPALSKRAP